MEGHNWKTAVLVLAALVVGGWLAGRGPAPGAQAQVVGGTGNVIAMIGTERSGDVPIVLVDSNEQSVVVYEYDLGTNRIELAAVRSYRYDRRLADWHGTNRPSVEDVRDAVEQAARRR